MHRATPGCAARLASLWLAALGLLSLIPWAMASDLRARLPQDEIIYFLLPDRFENGDASNDRGGLSGDRLSTGFDPTSKGFFHGGDLKGVLSRLDYIQSLGATALWLAPVFKNKPVQGVPGHESAGYHGYWITDFTHVDPHFGTDADLHALIDAVHARGMKLYMDIVVNHTADVIHYRECPDSRCPYRSRADYPYTRHGGIDGEAINPGFLGDAAEFQTPANFARLTRPDYAYTPIIAANERHVKVPEWLNDPIYYHNRGNSTFEGESSELGDFSGLDDLMTENPRVVQGFIDIYGQWIDDYGVDGFRIDTAKHVNPEFWQQFVPAMRSRAARRGIPNFHLFGEVASSQIDPALQARHTRIDQLPSVLDFALAGAIRATVAGHAGTQQLAEVFADDALYEGGTKAALQLVTFVSNHDAGRFAWFVREARPQAESQEVQQRVRLAYAMLLTLRGAPAIYYGDEQGFIGSGDDQNARQDMFPTRVASYQAEPVLGPSTTGAHFQEQHPLYQAIAELTHLRQREPALRTGLQTVRFAGPEPGLFAVSRFDPASGAEVLIAFNTASHPLSAQVDVDPRAQHFQALHGQCGAMVSAPGSYHVQLEPLDYVVCRTSIHP